jgi:hypothetical protein
MFQFSSRHPTSEILQGTYTALQKKHPSSALLGHLYNVAIIPISFTRRGPFWAILWSFLQIFSHFVPWLILAGALGYDQGLKPGSFMLNTRLFLSAASFSPEHRRRHRPQINAIIASREGSQSLPHVKAANHCLT